MKFYAQSMENLKSPLTSQSIDIKLILTNESILIRPNKRRRGNGDC